MEQVKNYFFDKNVLTVLDVGTGSGEFISVLKPIFPKAGFTGTDPSSEALEAARKLHPDVQFYEMGAEDLQFEDSSFDVVSISMALHHLPKVKKGLKELKRVVKPDGWIIISELFSDNLNPAQEVQKLFHHFRSQTDRLLGVNHRETFKKDEIIQIIQEAGISIQFFSEWKKEPVQPFGTPEINARVAQMEKMLEEIKGFPEFETLKPKINEFREKATLYGFQPATNVVVVGRKK